MAWVRVRTAFMSALVQTSASEGLGILTGDKAEMHRDGRLASGAGLAASNWDLDRMLLLAFVV